jgi:hypothetical protein
MWGDGSDSPGQLRLATLLGLGVLLLGTAASVVFLMQGRGPSAEYVATDGMVRVGVQLQLGEGQPLPDTVTVEVAGTPLVARRLR